MIEFLNGQVPNVITIHNNKIFSSFKLNNLSYVEQKKNPIFLDKILFLYEIKKSKKVIKHLMKLWKQNKIGFTTKCKEIVI